MNTGRPWLGNLASEELFQKVTVDPGRAAIFRRSGIHSLLIVPLVAAGRSIGVVLLGRAGTSEPFTEDDVETVQDIAARAAVSIDSARSYSHEHTMALELQRASLSEPSSPHSGTEVAARHLPSGRRVLVGGDWYDSLPLPGSRTLLVMGDVMGHRFQAAVAMSQYRSLLRTVAASGMVVEKILDEFDRRAVHLGLDRLATCLLAVMDPQAGWLLHTGRRRTPATRHPPSHGRAPTPRCSGSPPALPSAPGSAATSRSPYRWSAVPRSCFTPTAWWNDAERTSTSHCRSSRP
ncbi:hypothetical protein QFZ55_008039 [Streptomyces luteogriseus]|nr:hypothetical protein [Streptomyces luteogriseus]